MKSLLANLLLLLLCLQATTSNASESVKTEEIEKKDFFEDILRALEPKHKGKMTKCELEAMKEEVEKSLTELKDLKKKCMEGEEFPMKKAEDCTTLKEKLLYRALRYYDKEGNGKLSASEWNEVMRVGECFVITLNNLCKKAEVGEVRTEEVIGGLKAAWEKELGKIFHSIGKIFH